VIPNAIDTSPFRVGRSDGRFDVVFIGRLVDSQKGTTLLARVVRCLCSLKLPNLSVTIVGSGPGRESLQRSLEGLTGVRIAGQVTDSEKVEILADGNLMICTSRLDPSPVSVIEGLAAGLPVVSTPTGGSRFMLSVDGSLGKTVPPVPSGLAQTIVRYWDSWKADPAQYFQEKLHRSEVTARSFNLSAMYEQYVRMIERLVDRGE